MFFIFFIFTFYYFYYYYFFYYFYFILFYFVSYRRELQMTISEVEVGWRTDLVFEDESADVAELLIARPLGRRGDCGMLHVIHRTVLARFTSSRLQEDEHCATTHHITPAQLVAQPNVQVFQLGVSMRVLRPALTVLYPAWTHLRPARFTKRPARIEKQIK